MEQWDITTKERIKLAVIIYGGFGLLIGTGCLIIYLKNGW